jgi:hypothetical protein
MPDDHDVDGKSATQFECSIGIEVAVQVIALTVASVAGKTVRGTPSAAHERERSK